MKKHIRPLITGLAAIVASAVIVYLYLHGTRFELAVGALLGPLALGVGAALATPSHSDEPSPSARPMWPLALRLLGVVACIAGAALTTHLGGHWYGVAGWAVTGCLLAARLGESIGMGDAAEEHLVLADRITNLEKWFVELLPATDPTPQRSENEDLVPVTVGGVVYELHPATDEDLDREGPWFDHDNDLKPEQLDEMEALATRALADGRPVVSDLADAVLRLVHPAREQLFPETGTPPGDERMQVVLRGAVSREDVERAIATLDAP